MRPRTATAVILLTLLLPACSGDGTTASVDPDATAVPVEPTATAPDQAATTSPPPSSPAPTSTAAGDAAPPPTAAPPTTPTDGGDQATTPPPAEDPTGDPQPTTTTLTVDGLAMEIRRACYDAATEVTDVDFGAEANLRMAAGDPPVMTIGSEGQFADSTDVAVTPGEPATYAGTFPEGNPYGATTAVLITTPQALPAC